MLGLLRNSFSFQFILLSLHFSLFEFFRRLKFNVDFVITFKLLFCVSVKVSILKRKYYFSLLFDIGKNHHISRKAGMTNSCNEHTHIGLIQGKNKF
ncbi:hypothetical protein IC582_030414 [Cucumis melo]